jgi:hypothetical protein
MRTWKMMAWMLTRGYASYPQGLERTTDVVRAQQDNTLIYHSISARRLVAYWDETNSISVTKHFVGVWIPRCQTEQHLM